MKKLCTKLGINYYSFDVNDTDWRKVVHEGHRVKVTSGKFNLWFYKGKLSRYLGPAIESRSSKVYYNLGNIHRLGGPAVIIDDLEIYYNMNKEIRRVV